jgi:cephalosporin-C deacetylase-like acetyl esterase
MTLYGFCSLELFQGRQYLDPNFDDYWKKKLVEEASTKGD